MNTQPRSKSGMTEMKLKPIQWFEDPPFVLEVREASELVVNRTWKGEIMLSWTLTFLIIALLAGLLGFTGIAGMAAWIAKVLFVLFLVLFLVSLIRGRKRA